MEPNFDDPDLQRFSEQVRIVLFGNLGAWKTAINSQTPVDLRKFLVHELDKMETRLIGYAQILLNAKTAIPAWLWDQNLELLAYLETIIEDPYLEAKLPPLPSSESIPQSSSNVEGSP